MIDFLIGYALGASKTSDSSNAKELAVLIVVLFSLGCLVYVGLGIDMCASTAGKFDAAWCHLVKLIAQIAMMAVAWALVALGAVIAGAFMLFLYSRTQKK